MNTSSTTPLWKGPIEDGITFSLLSKFINCRERFRIKVIEGLVEDEGFRTPLEFGSMWHEAEEAFAAGKDWNRSIRKYRDKLRAEYSESEVEINKMLQICQVTFPEYIDYWKHHGDEIHREPILEEVSFKVPFHLPSGRYVNLRGKFDCVFKTKQSIWLQENKTKGRIDEEGIGHTLFGNLQAMIYQNALRECGCVSHHHGINFPGIAGTFTPKGTLYNVVRRPLADIYSIRQRKTETDKQFYQRLQTVIHDKPEHYFMRWKVNIRQKDMETFNRNCLYPILEQLLDWWEWIECDPFDPWDPSKRGCESNWLHWRAPWGVYDSLAGGFRGDYFDYLTTGRTIKLKKIKTLYPEL